MQWPFVPWPSVRWPFVRWPFDRWPCVRVAFSPGVVQVFLGLEPSTSYSMHFFTQLSSSFRNTCPYHRSLFCCNSNTNVMSSIPDLSLSAPYLNGKKMTKKVCTHCTGAIFFFQLSTASSVDFAICSFYINLYLYINLAYSSGQA